MLQFALRRQQMPVEETFELLRDTALERGYQDWLRSRARLEKTLFVLVWITIIVAHILSLVFNLNGDPARASMSEFSATSATNLAGLGNILADLG